MTTYGRPGVYISERLLPAPLTVNATANAAGACIGKFAKGPETVTLVTSWYDFVQKFGGYSNAYPATFGVGSFFQNGGSELFVRRVLSTDVGTTGAEAEIVSGESKVADVTSKNRGSEANLIRVQVSAVSGARPGYYNFTVYLEGAQSSDSVASNDVIVEQFSNVVFNDPISSDFIENIVNGNSQYVNIDVDSVNANLTPSFLRVSLTGGSDGDDPVSSDYEAAVEDFSVIDRPLVLFAPEINSQGIEDAEDVINTMVEWAEANNGFVVADTSEALTSAGAPGLTVSQALNYAGALQISSSAAVYYPNIYISDPLGRSASALRKIGPAGAVSGLYLFTDRQTGPFKAPAGLRATIRGAVGVEKQFTTAELDTLNSANSTSQAPVNALRNLPGAGIVVMGARTLLQDGTANKYVNTRRSLIFIKKSLNDLTQFALFENNDQKLWARIRSSVAVFLTSYLNQGGLRGDAPAQAFYVKCDAENNPQASILNSEVNIEVGVALQYPAEFVVITLSQNTSA
jgi:phage tail sheath protein FI